MQEYQGNDAAADDNAEQVLVDNPTAPGAPTEQDRAAKHGPDQQLVRNPSAHMEVGPSNNLQFPKNVMEEFIVDELLHSAHPREMLPLFWADVPRGGRIFSRRTHKPRFFGQSPYLARRDSYSLRFWTQEQAIYYARMLMNKEKIFKHQYLDLPSLYETTCFQNLAEAIDDLHAHRMFSINAGFNPEVIK